MEYAGQKLHIIANEEENYYVMDALHYVDLKYCRENFFEERRRDLQLDIISVNSPLFWKNIWRDIQIHR